MRLTRIRLGDYILESKLKNVNDLYSSDAVVGISTSKEMIETKANLDGVKLTSYKILPPNHFAYVPDTSRRGDKISLCFNNTKESYLVSSISIVFYVQDSNNIYPDYLYMYFNRPEFDRYSRFNSWGSARETFSWEDMCNIELELPPIDIQQKYVDIYNAMVENQKSYEKGLEDLKLVCDGYIEELYINTPKEKIGSYIKQKNKKNEDLKFDVASVKGISNDKTFIETKANMKNVSLKQYLIVDVMDFAYVPVTSRNGEKISLALNNGEGAYICSSSYTVFSTNKSKLLPEYLAMWFSRKEFDRYARFHSWGSARETFTWEDMSEVEIPIPDLSIQQNIVNIYKVYQERKEINEKLKQQIKDICPILIKGSIEEARK
jgi:hypothetical protein